AAPRPVRRSQTPLLLGVAVELLVGLAWLAWLIATGSAPARLETVARATAVLIPLGLGVGIAWSRLGQPQASELVVELRGRSAGKLRGRLRRGPGGPTPRVRDPPPHRPPLRPTAKPHESRPAARRS